MEKFTSITALIFNRKKFSAFLFAGVWIIVLVNVIKTIRFLSLLNFKHLSMIKSSTFYHKIKFYDVQGLKIRQSNAFENKKKFSDECATKYKHTKKNCLMIKIINKEIMNMNIEHTFHNKAKLKKKICNMKIFDVDMQCLHNENLAIA